MIHSTIRASNFYIALAISWCLSDTVNAAERIKGMYFPSWAVYNQSAKLQVKDIPSGLTHIFYAFAKLEKGECVLADPYADLNVKFESSTDNGNIAQLQLIKKKNPMLKLMLSVGGWTMSKGFSTAANSNITRTKMAKSCVALLNLYKFDGIDIDWEHPGAKAHWSTEFNDKVDKLNYSKLLEAMRLELGPGQLLTTAYPFAKAALERIELDKIFKSIDFMNAMAYDLAGNWSSKTSHHAPLRTTSGMPNPTDNIADLTAYMKKKKVPLEKIVVGFPFYGRAWDNVDNVTADNHGLFLAHNCTAWSERAFSYEEIEKDFTVKSGWKEWFDTDAGQAVRYNVATQKVLSFDNTRSIQKKAEFVVEQNLGGGFAWEFTTDNKRNELLHAFVDALDGKSKGNV